MTQERAFAWWKWALVALLGLFVWQFIVNTDFIAFQLLQSFGWLDGAGPIWPAITTIIAAAIALPGFALVYRWPGGGLRRLGLTLEKWRSDEVLGLGVGALQSGLSIFLIIPLLGSAADDTFASVSGLFESPARIAASIILLLVYGGLIEELFFRGHIITSVGNALGGHKWSRAIAVALSAALFAISHDYQGVVGMSYAMFAALIWAILFVWTRRLTASIVAHGSYDLLTLIGIIVFYSDKVSSG